MLHAEEAREEANRINADISGILPRIDNDITEQICRGEHSLYIEYKKYNNMSLQYWKHVRKHYRELGYKVNARGTIITIIW